MIIIYEAGMRVAVKIRKIPHTTIKKEKAYGCLYIIYVYSNQAEDGAYEAKVCVCACLLVSGDHNPPTLNLQLPATLMGRLHCPLLAAP